MQISEKRCREIRDAPAQEIGHMFVLWFTHIAGNTHIVVGI